MELYFEWDEAKKTKRIRKNMMYLLKRQASFLKILYGSQSRIDIPMVKNVGKRSVWLKVY
jgi:hypothetical protein